MFKKSCIRLVSTTQKQTLLRLILFCEISLEERHTNISSISMHKERDPGFLHVRFSGMKWIWPFVQAQIYLWGNIYRDQATTLSGLEEWMKLVMTLAFIFEQEKYSDSGDVQVMVLGRNWPIERQCSLIERSWSGIPGSFWMKILTAQAYTSETPES